MAKDTKQTEKATALKDAVATTVTDAQEQAVKNAIVEEQNQGVQEAKAKADAEAQAKAAAEAKVPKYGFTTDAPQSIRYNGEVYTQEEVLTNEDLLAELVQGKCIFIKRN